MYIRELIFRSQDSDLLEEYFKEIKDLKKIAQDRENKRKEMEDLVEQPKLQLGKVAVLQGVFSRPSLEGKKMPGTLTLHKNGLRYQNPQGKSVGEFTLRIPLHSQFHNFPVSYPTFLIRYCVQQYQTLNFPAVRKRSFRDHSHPLEKSYHDWKKEDQRFSSLQGGSRFSLRRDWFAFCFVLFCFVLFASIPIAQFPSLFSLFSLFWK